MAFVLAVVWAHPYQECLSSLDEAVKKLTMLINSGDNWAYAFVWLNEDAQHVPLSKEGHLSTMIDGVPSRSMCGHLHQLDICQLLQCGDQVVYPERLNGGLDPVLTSLTGSLVQGVNMLGAPAHESSFLLVDLSQVTLGDHAPEASAPCRTSTPTSPSHPAMEHPPKADSHISMTSEVQELLSHAILDASSQSLWNSTQRGQHLWPWEFHPPTKLVATSTQASLQVAIPDDTLPVSQTPEVSSAPTLPPTRTPGADMGAFPKEVILLQGEMNRAMGHLLPTRASIDTHGRKQVLDFKMAICQNEAEATQAIREMKDHCEAAIREVEANHTATHREAEAHCTTTIREAIMKLS